MPKEKMSVVFGRDLDVSVHMLGHEFDPFQVHLPSMHFQQRSIGLSRQRLYIIVSCGLLGPDRRGSQQYDSQCTMQ